MQWSSAEIHNGVIAVFYKKNSEGALYLQAIGARNLIKSMAKQREAQQEQLHAMVAEKRMQLERYTPVSFVVHIPSHDIPVCCIV